MKRLLAGWILFGMIVVVFAGCGDTSSGGDCTVNVTTTADADVNKPVSTTTTTNPPAK